MSTYAFDDCSILHLANIEIPEAFKIFFNDKYLCHNNYPKLSKFCNKLKDKHKFVPSNIDSNVIKVGNELLNNCGNVQMLPITFKSNIMEQLKDFIESISDEYSDIEKDNNIDDVKNFFENNERQLKKEKNIPEDDDMSTLVGYKKFECESKKHLITEDEHFWGYTDLIEEEFDIIVIEEWNCDKI